VLWYSTTLTGLTQSFFLFLLFLQSLVHPVWRCLFKKPSLLLLASFWKPVEGQHPVALSCLWARFTFGFWNITYRQKKRENLLLEDFGKRAWHPASVGQNVVVWGCKPNQNNRMLLFFFLFVLFTHPTTLNSVWRRRKAPKIYTPTKRPSSLHVFCGLGEGLRPCPPRDSVKVAAEVRGPRVSFVPCITQSELCPPSGSKVVLVHGVGLHQGCPSSPVLFGFSWTGSGGVVGGRRASGSEPQGYISALYRWCGSVGFFKICDLLDGSVSSSAAAVWTSCRCFNDVLACENRVAMIQSGRNKFLGIFLENGPNRWHVSKPDPSGLPDYTPEDKNYGVRLRMGC